ncbi:MAG TPA: glycosyltransferase family 87 protein [Terriglobia bacterium]|nr:glycosyltransferase family 87 protein [Terriglobia bacterium]
MQSPKPPTARETRIALGLTAGLLLFVVVASVVVVDPTGFDFSSIYAGATIVRQGNGSKLYDSQEQARVQNQLFKWDHLFLDSHPPFEALLFAPLTKLPYRQAYVLWGAINVLLWIWFQRLLRPHAALPSHPFHYFMLCSLFFPLWAGLMQGQLSVVLLVLFSLAFVCLKRRQDFWGGSLLGFALFKGIFVIPFSLICLLRGKWRLMGGFAFGASVLTGLSIIAVGPSGLAAYMRVVTNTANHPSDPAYGTKFSAMPSVEGFITTLLSGTAGRLWITVAVGIVSGFLILFTARRWRRLDRDGDEAASNGMFAAALVISLLVAPHMYVHNLTVMLLAVLLVLGFLQGSGRRAWRLVLMASVVVLYAAPAYVLLLRWDEFYLFFPVLLAFALAVLALARSVPPSEPIGQVDNEVRCEPGAAG